jgi:uncharacterized membrane protein
MYNLEGIFSIIGCVVLLMALYGYRAKTKIGMIFKMAVMLFLLMTAIRIFGRYMLSFIIIGLIIMLICTIRKKK